MARRGQVDDAQTPVSKRYASIIAPPHAGIVGAAMCKSVERIAKRAVVETQPAIVYRNCAEDTAHDSIGTLKTSPANRFEIARVLYHDGFLPVKEIGNAIAQIGIETCARSDQLFAMRAHPRNAPRA